jgi:hypothetical protein
VVPVTGANAESRGIDGAGAYECVNAIDLAGSKIFGEIDGLIQEPPSEAYIKPSGGWGLSNGLPLTTFRKSRSARKNSNCGKRG